MEAIVKYLTTEWGVILQAPVIYLTSAALVAVFVWTVFQWSYANRINDLEGRVKFRDDEISDYKRKLSGATPEEARNRIDALELQIASLAPRRLSVEQRQKLLGVIRGNQFRIDITRDMGAHDARRFCHDFIETFRIAGWLIQDPQVMGLGNPPFSGNAIRVRDPVNLRPAEALVKQALEAANIPFDVQPGLRVTSPMPLPPPGFPTYSLRPDPDVELLITSPLD